LGKEKETTCYRRGKKTEGASYKGERGGEKKNSINRKRGKKKKRRTGLPSPSTREKEKIKTSQPGQKKKKGKGGKSFFKFGRRKKREMTFRRTRKYG